MAMAKPRLQKEAILLSREPPPLIRAKPAENDIMVFHYVIEGPPQTPYEGGYYHGVLKFPSEYPLKPPSVQMYTPSGRFKPRERLCLSMSDYHPESWNPAWSTRTILVGLQSFMVETAITAGSIETSDDEKKRLAAESLKANCTDKDFCKLFPELVELAKKKGLVK